MARRPRGLVDGARFLAPLDDAAYGPAADDHGHVVHGCMLRQRERVDGFDLLLKRVSELLGHGNARHRPGDLGLDVRVLERAGSAFANERAGRVLAG
jgi:hypothetical protein